MVRDHVTPVCSIHDIADALASNILAKFPAAFLTQLNFFPDIRKIYKEENLLSTECSFTKRSTSVERPLFEPYDTYLIRTEWPLPMSLPSGFMVSLKLQTIERCASPVHDQISSSKNSRLRPSFHYVHPTLGLHRQVASTAAKELQSGTAEGAALYLARYLFHLADEQSPCKRFQKVFVNLQEMIPFSEEDREEVRSRASKIKVTQHREKTNNYFTVCRVGLDRQHYEQSQLSLQSKDFQSGRHRAFLALGSNLGNRVEMIESAVRKMGDRGLSVSRTSALYETKPMYLENQESFINGACEVRSVKISYR